MKLLLIPIALGLFTQSALACRCITPGASAATVALNTEDACTLAEGTLDSTTGECSLKARHKYFAYMCMRNNGFAAGSGSTCRFKGGKSPKQAGAD
ncbi:hypothetical protein E2P81_ATG04263 [Venturia nashicola]|nr:hypothetical protein E2P81_ATG04263 [Venturia nashicola]